MLNMYTIYQIYAKTKRHDETNLGLRRPHKVLLVLNHADAKDHRRTGWQKGSFGPTLTRGHDPLRRTLGRQRTIRIQSYSSSARHLGETKDFLQGLNKKQKRGCV